MKRPDNRPRAGFTLLELLVTMTVMAVMLGLGVGLFANLGFEARGTSGIVKTLVRTTREEAVRTGLPARVDFDAQQGDVRGFFFQVIGSWHFETGYREHKRTSEPGRSSPPSNAGATWGFDSGAGLNVTARQAKVETRGGYPGGFLRFEPKGKLVIDTLGSNTFMTDVGFAVSFAIRPQQGTDGVLVRRAEAYEVRASANGQLRASIALAESYGDAGEQRAAGEMRLITPERVLVPGKWSRVTLVFDGRLGQLLVDGRRVARDDRLVRLSTRVRPLSTITFGGSGAFDLDDVRLYDCAEQGPIELPEGAKLVLFGADEARPRPRLSVFFTADGFLDPIAHRVPLEFAVELDARGESATPRQDRYRVGLLGSLQDP